VTSTPQTDHEAAVKPGIDALRPLATRVVGSYCVPNWLGGLKTDRHRGRISAGYLESIHDELIKAAVKDQELVGLDIVSDGELRRDNEVDYLLEQIPGVEIVSRPKTYYQDYLDAVLVAPLPEGEEAACTKLVDDFRFVSRLTDRPVTMSLPGPFSLSRRLRDEAYHDQAAFVRALGRYLHGVAAGLAAAGARYLQIDEPFLAGYPEVASLAVEAINLVTTGVDVHWAAHICYGNRYARPVWEGHYDFLFPPVLEAQVDQLVLEFARKGYDDLTLFQRYPSKLQVGVGVIDVKSVAVEPPEVVARRIYQALAVMPADRLMVNPDCGLRHLPPDVARAKLQSMTAAAELVRADVLGVRLDPAAADHPPAADRPAAVDHEESGQTPASSEAGSATRDPDAQTAYPSEGH
jgi:5-methyltetrahydropteroyltriglutamate--homocysteine methyltransferase